MSDFPDLVVGVDFGMTFTGVAFVNTSLLAAHISNATSTAKVHCIQEWPGRAQAAQNKVPTTLSYAKDNAARLRWGFRAEDQRQLPEHQYACWFKTFLDPEILGHAKREDPDHTPGQEEVYSWIVDYLHQLYLHTKNHLSKQHLQPPGPWETAKIEILFTVPTTWNARIVAKFEELVKQAGWGACRSHTLRIGLTEAEAAAVHAACEGDVVMSDNEIILVCDAGGGTTDLSILRVTGVLRGIPGLKQLMAVQGENTGSTHIDGKFADFVHDSLEKIQQQLIGANGLPINIEDAAWTMTKSVEFQDNKCSCGWPDYDNDFYVPIPDIPDTFTTADETIRDGQFKVTQQELQALFDTQVELLFGLIDSQLAAFAKEYPTEDISRMVLSGGLGKSEYVRQKLQEKYSMRVGEQPSTHMTVHVSKEPQLAVCKGVCLDRLGKLRDGRSVLGTRYCRASYGTEVKIPHDPKNKQHWHKKIERDVHDKKDYICKGIEWFIVRGTPIDVDEPIVRRFNRKIKPGDPRAAFRFCDKIITSNLISDKLPITFDDPAKARELCKLTFKFSADDEKRFKRKNRHWWSFGAEYMRVEYEVRVKVGAADVTFELWFEGQKLSEDRPIEVEWITVQDPGKANPEETAYYPHQDAPVTKLMSNKRRLW